MAGPTRVPAPSGPAPADGPAGGALPRIVIVGGGIAGLAAALALAGRAEVTVLEATDRVGGKLRTTPFDGLPALEEGAESFLVRVPDGQRLARAVGLGHELVHPATTSASLWLNGRLRPLPARTLLGVPTDLGALVSSRVLSARGLARMAADLVLPREAPPAGAGADRTVGGYVGSRVGREIVERLVDPLLGGVYAGNADRLSLAATVPQLLPIAAEDRSLLLGARRVRARTAPAGPGPAAVFATVRGGLAAFAARVADASGARVLLRAPVRSLTRTATGGWEVATGSGDPLAADGVILAVPGGAARRLLAPLAPDAAGLLADVPYASMALVTLVYRGIVTPPGSGFLVPVTEHATIKAATFLSAKWPHVTAGTGLTVIRASVGRAGDAGDLQRPDVELAGVAAAEVAAVAGIVARPLSWRVSRWEDGLPQYLPGHLARVDSLRRALPAGVAVAGAAYDGVGIPACIRSGEAAAETVLARLNLPAS